MRSRDPQWVADRPARSASLPSTSPGRKCASGTQRLREILIADRPWTERTAVAAGRHVEPGDAPSLSRRWLAACATRVSETDSSVPSACSCSAGSPAVATAARTGTRASSSSRAPRASRTAGRPVGLEESADVAAGGSVRTAAATGATVRAGRVSAATNRLTASSAVEDERPMGQLGEERPFVISFSTAGTASTRSLAR
jgi:hypothetical protein